MNQISTPWRKRMGITIRSLTAAFYLISNLNLEKLIPAKWMLRYMMLNAKFSQIKLFRGTYDNYHGTEIIWWSILFWSILQILYKSTVVET